MDKSVNMKFNILAIFAIIILCIGISPIGLQNDTFYTVKIGEHILQNGIDMQDPFSWHENLSYTYPHWLYDIIIYIIYNSFGWNGIYISTVILACILGITLYFTNTKITKNNLTSFILTMRNYVFIKIIHSGKSTINNFYFICIYNIFYRMFFRNEEEKICNRFNNYTTSYS